MPGDAALPADLSAGDIPIPPGMLGKPLSVSTTGHVDSRGWGLDMADRCTRQMSSSPYMGTKSLQIDAVGAGVYRITAGQDDAFAMTYQLEVSPAAPTATWSNHVDPIYGTLRTHTYVLGVRSLNVSIDTLHDNDSPTPLPQCWEYSYLHVSTAGQLTW